MQEDPTEKKPLWLRPDAQNLSLQPGLYLAATPIGNLGDITLRALDVLASCDLVVCEDTRVSKKLLTHFGIKKEMVPYNDHSAEKSRGQILEHLSQGKVVVFISDAGMPLISDPGYKLVQDCMDLGIYVTSVPGANAPLAALQLSGLPSHQFCFLGFLPPKETARQKFLRDWQNVQASLIVFETAPRLLDALGDIQKIFGDRKVAVVREITKLYEEVRRGSADELITFYEEEGLPKGEIVLVIAPGQIQEMSDEELMVQLKVALETMSTKEAASFVAEMSGRSRKEIYKLALEVANDES